MKGGDKDMMKNNLFEGHKLMGLKIIAIGILVLANFYFF